MKNQSIFNDVKAENKENSEEDEMEGVMDMID